MVIPAKKASPAPVVSFTSTFLAGQMPQEPDVYKRQLFDNVQVPHYNYVGDSILGYKSHMGAGSITSNVKSDKLLVVVKDGAEQVETGRKKVGAMLGDRVEVGCNSVLNPGTVIGPDSNVYPTSCVRGVIPASHVYKDKDHIIAKK